MMGLNKTRRKVVIVVDVVVVVVVVDVVVVVVVVVVVDVGAMPQNKNFDRTNKKVSLS